MTLRVMFVGLCAVALAAGCDSDDGGSGTPSGGGGSGSGSAPKVSHDVDTSKNIESLSDSEVQALCEAYEDAVSGLVTKEVSCKIGALAAAAFGGAEACDAAYQQCLSQPGEAPSGIDNTCQIDEDKVADCPDVTVGEMEACMNDAIALSNQAYAALDDLSCEDGLSGTEGLSGLDAETPASCKTIQDKCPELMESSDSTAPE